MFLFLADFKELLKLLQIMIFLYLSQVCLNLNFFLSYVCLYLIFVPVLRLSLFYVIGLSYVCPMSHVLCLSILCLSCPTFVCPTFVLISSLFKQLTKRTLFYTFFLLNKNKFRSIDIHLLQLRQVDLNYKIPSDFKVHALKTRNQGHIQELVQGRARYAQGHILKG